MKVSDYVANYISTISPRVYGVCGAGAMHLNDAIANHPGINVISMQNEQAAAMAAEADARVTGNISVVSVTAGPGGTNALTGVACAYVDSIPMLIIAGQVTSHTMMGRSGTRQVGMNELDLVSVMFPVTKWCLTVKDPNEIRKVLEAAVSTATHGRKGPVFIEIPLDIQAAEIDPDALEGIDLLSYDSVDPPYLFSMSMIVHDEFAGAKRPVVVIGNGVRLADAIEEFRKVFDNASIPIVSSWGAADIMPTDHPNYIGRCGIFGDRAANFTVQNADVVLAIGTRLTVAQIGHASKLFAKNAKKIIIDIDNGELHRKSTIAADIGIEVDAKEFLKVMLPIVPKHDRWLKRCQSMKEKYKPEWKQPTTGISSYGFVQSLTNELEDTAIVVTDVGFCFIPTFQTMRLRSGQRLIHSAGVSPMGWGIPAAIGAAFATDGKRQIVCLTGDGGAMMNLQELQTIAHHKLPIAIFVYENDGYATMKIAQNNHFKREVMSGPRSGLSLPDFTKIAKAFGILTREFNSLNLLSHSLQSLLDTAAQVPVVIVMHMDPHEVIAPRVQAKTENGKFVPTDIADLWPYLPREEFASNMNPETHGVPDVVKRFDRQ